MRVVLILLSHLGQGLLVSAPAGFEVKHEPVEERHAEDREGIEDDGGSAGASEVKATKCKG